MTNYPPRLIEVDLPIKRISAHARREKSIRHGHISTLHIWWARRPLAACRAVICAALWPDPVDERCPQAFRDRAADIILAFVSKVTTSEHLSESCSAESLGRWLTLKKQGQLDATQPAHLNVLRNALFDFIADFANWDNSTVPEYLETARALTQAAHEALGGEPGTRPLVVDPFAGGGAIPLEALRVGADAFASDLNPVAVLLNKVVLEYIPKYGQRLADEVRKWGKWIKAQAEQELAEFYPKDPDGATPIAYLWARTITCEGPGCGAEVPLMRSLWLAKKNKNAVAFRLVPRPRAKRVDLEIIENAKAKDVGEGTNKRGSVTCPVCGYTTPVTRVRTQLQQRRGGTADARMLCVVTTQSVDQGRYYRIANDKDLEVFQKAATELHHRQTNHIDLLPLVPDEPLPPQGTLGFRVQLYGMKQWCDLFNDRQLLALTTVARLVREAGDLLGKENPADFAAAVQSVLSILVDKMADSNSAQIWWMASGEKTVGTFTRQAVQMIWDFGEVPLTDAPSRNLGEAVQWILRVIEHINSISGQTTSGQAIQGDACRNNLPDDSVTALVTDPPYYDAVPYADLSDFFYIWLKRTLPSTLLTAFGAVGTPKEAECITDESKGKGRAYFEQTMTQAMAESRRVLSPKGIAVVVFAHKSTAGWEAMLQGLLQSGWVITGTWPIDTEREVKVNTISRAFLGSSIHLICRPRENADGSIRADDIGDWRDVLVELPKRIREWMPRLAREGVVGADAIFACLGPALEIFSRYSQVEKASGEVVTLREYLEQVWATVAKEAFKMIFEGADASGFEQDARLTAIWFWAMKSAENDKSESDESGSDTSDEETDEEKPSEGKKPAGYSMEYDTARKLAQGLGVDLQALSRPGGIITVHGNVATLNSIGNRERFLVGQLTLFGEEVIVNAKRAKGSGQSATVKMKSVNARQDELFAKESTVDYDSSQAMLPSFKPPEDSRSLMERLLDSGSSVLDRLHQAMLLFGRAQTSLLGSFLLETQMGNNQRFWSLAQALSALYPATTDEKRWVDGVLARKKGLGF